MATQESKDAREARESKSSKFDPPTTTEDALRNAENAEADRDDDHDERVVPPFEGDKHGYIGYRPRTEPNESFTVAGVTGGTANVADTPKSVRQATRKP